MRLKFKTLLIYHVILLRHLIVSFPVLRFEIPKFIKFLDTDCYQKIKESGANYYFKIVLLIEFLGRKGFFITDVLVFRAKQLSAWQPAFLRGHRPVFEENLLYHHRNFAWCTRILKSLFCYCLQTLFYSDKH